MSTREDIPFILEQVSKCLRLAAACHDKDVAEGLLKLATAFARRATELGADPLLIPKQVRPQKMRRPHLQPL